MRERRKSTFLRLTTALSLVFVLSFSPAIAFQVNKTSGGNEIKWNADFATYYINISGGPSDTIASVQAALQTWTGVATSSFIFIYGGTTTSTAHGSNDGANIVTFAPMGTTGTLAENMFWFYTTGQLIDSDIQFNTSYGWGTDGSPDVFDMQNVCTHELGHSLSLADLYGSADTEKTMYGYSSPGETKQRTLDQDDIDGISHLYQGGCTLPGKPALSSPSSGATGISSTPTLDWGDVSGAASYDAQVCSDSGCLSLACSANVSSSQWTVSPALNSNTNYYWRARGNNTCGSGPWSSIRGFITASCSVPGKPALSSPSSGATGVSSTPTLDWGDVSGATSYDVQVCSDSGCLSLAGSANVSSSQWTVSPALNSNTNYYWRARGNNTCGSGPWSSIRGFITAGCAVPGKPALSSPSSGASRVSVTPTLDWRDVSGAASYDVQVCSKSSCSSVARSATLGVSQWTVSPALNTKTTYYWRARGDNACGSGKWSGVRSFTTGR